MIGELQRAWALLERGQRHEARELFERLRDLAIDDAPALQLYAAVALKLDEAEPARARIRRAIRLAPDDPQNHLLLALAEIALDRAGPAKGALRRALRLRPGWADAVYHLAHLLDREGASDEARAMLREALERSPGDADLWNQLALVEATRGAYERALEAHRQAHAHAPADPRVAFNLGTALLRLGRDDEGWPLFENRLRFGAQRAPDSEAARWRGEPLDGRSILLWNEQGLGDTIHFARYAPLLRERGAGRIVLRCQPALVRALGAIGDEVVSTEETAPSTELHVPLGSLPLHLGGRPVPAAIVADRRERPPGDERRVGLVWAGNPDHADDDRRSLPGALFRPLCEIEGVRAVSLQYGGAAAGLRHPRLVTLGDEALGDLAATAGWLKTLDALVTVDTAIVHLAGSLGLPTWLRLGPDPDWRWGVEEPMNSWYPSVRLCRQRPGERPAAVVGRIAEQLREPGRPSDTQSAT